MSKQDLSSFERHLLRLSVFTGITLFAVPILILFCAYKYAKSIHDIYFDEYD